MGEPKWTPGPWKADIRRGCVVVYPANEHHESLGRAEEWAIHCKVGRLVRDDQGRPLRWEVPEEVVANARLIAAAPDLYEACEEALHALAVAKDRATVLGDTLRNMGAPDQNRLQFETLMNRAADRIEAALRKARGEDG